MVTKSAPRGALKSASKTPLLALSEIEEKELVIDAVTLKKLEKYLAKNGGEKSGLSLSDVVTHLLLEKGPNGFKFSSEKNGPKTLSLRLPRAAWNIAEKSAKKSGVSDVAEVVKKLASKL